MSEIQGMRKEETIDKQNSSIDFFFGSHIVTIAFLGHGK